MDAAISGAANIEGALNVEPRGREIPNPVVSASEEKTPKCHFKRTASRGDKRTTKDGRAVKKGPSV